MRPATVDLVRGLIIIHHKSTPNLFIFNPMVCFLDLLACSLSILAYGLWPIQRQLSYLSSLSGKRLFENELYFTDISIMF
jgi:hypothetical protein